MTTFDRIGHWRTNMYGTRYWVARHSVSRYDGLGSSSEHLAQFRPQGISLGYRTIESFVNPNAQCPACCAPVFFYRSPTGGSVYFDELGPPWPKHPCLDQRQFLRLENLDVIRSTAEHAPPAKTLRSSRGNWVPLVIKELALRGQFDLLIVEKKYSSLGDALLPVPKDVLRSRPLFWRRNLDDPSMIDISSVDIDVGEVREIIFQAPAWIKYQKYVPDNLGVAIGSSQEWNAIGWAASFAWRSPSNADWFLSESVDWEWAKVAFERGAEDGYWACINNLAVMYREGFGVDRNVNKAFEMFRDAAQRLESAPLRHLARCYREGSGTVVDEGEADFLLELADLVEIEKKSG